MLEDPKAEQDMILVLKELIVYGACKTCELREQKGPSDICCDGGLGYRPWSSQGGGSKLPGMPIFEEGSDG